MIGRCERKCIRRALSRLGVVRRRDGEGYKCVAVSCRTVWVYQASPGLDSPPSIVHRTLISDCMMPNQNTNLSSRSSSSSSSGPATPSSYVFTSLVPNAADLLVTRYSGVSTPLTAQALSVQNANPSAVDQQWALEEVRRIARLQQAARDLGFDLPPQCYRR